MTIIRLFFTILLLASCALSQRLPVQTYTTKDGLSSNFITEIYQDSRGYLWIGTDEGISIFDGNRFKNIRFDDSKSWGYINDIIERKNRPGEMWIATNGGGLIRFTNGEMTPFSLGGEPTSNFINSIVELENGILSCATDNGIHTFSMENGSAVRNPLPQVGKYTKFSQSLDGTIWCYDEMELFIYSPKEQTLSVPNVPGLPTDSIIYVSALSDSSISVHVREPKNAAVYIIKNDRIIKEYHLFSQSAYFTVKGPYDRYWIGTGDGIQMMQEGGSRPFMWIYTTTNGLPINELTIGFQDREQNIWFGSFGRGLTKLETYQSTQFIFPGMSGKGALDRAEHLWVPSSHGLYELWRDSVGLWKRFLHVVRSNNHMLSPVTAEFDRNDRLWITNENGSLFSFDVSRNENNNSTLKLKHSLSEQNGFPRALTITLFVDSKNILWYCLLDGGLAGVDCSGEPKLVASFPYGVNTTLRDVRAMSEDAAGRIWALGYDPVNRIVRHTPGGIVLDSTDAILTALPDVPLRAVMQASDGSMWFGSRYNGLYHYRDGALNQVTSKEGLISNQIWSLAETPEKGLLIGTQAGLMHMPDQRTNTFTSLQQYTQSPVQTLGSTPSFAFALTRFEVTIFDIPDDTSFQLFPQVLFTSFFVNGKEQQLSKEVELSSSENTISIEYTAISFRNTRALRFQYRLEPLEEEWSPATTNRSVTYANLPPGKYLFAVRALNQQGLAGEVSSILPVSIASPFWMSWWFITMIIAGVFGIVATVERVRVRRLLEIEKIRSRIAADLHDDIGSGLTRIALLSDMIHRQAVSEKQQTDPQFTVPSLTEKVGAISRELVDAMSDVVWSIDPKNSSMERLLQRVQTFAVEVCEAKEIELEFTVTPELEKLKVGSDSIRAVLLVAKEALTNVVRHSNARKVVVTLRSVKQQVIFEISDDGKGFDIAELSRMNGLTNMRLRIEKNGGTFTLDSAKGRGTFVAATIPLHK